MKAKAGQTNPTDEERIAIRKAMALSKKMAVFVEDQPMEIVGPALAYLLGWIVSQHPSKEERDQLLEHHFDTVRTIADVPRE